MAETAKLGRTAELTPSIKELIHELQKERGRSAGFVGSSGNVGLGSKLAAQRLKTDSQFAALDAAFSDNLLAASVITSAQTWIYMLISSGIGVPLKGVFCPLAEK